MAKDTLYIVSGCKFSGRPLIYLMATPDSERAENFARSWLADMVRGRSEVTVDKWSAGEDFPTMHLSFYLAQDGRVEVQSTLALAL